MGTIVATEFVSLDGVFEDRGGAEGTRHGGWTFAFDRGADGNQFKVDELEEAEVQLLGRGTYEGFAAAWPKMNEDPFGQKMNAMPKYVVSRTLTSADWTNSTILAGDLAQEVGELRREVEGVILIAGSGQLVRGLLELGLVDELRLMVFPVVLGSGRRLFGEADEKLTLTLASSQVVGDGVVILTYRAVGAPGDG
jgi:dihydrofolate reductase